MGRAKKAGKRSGSRTGTSGTILIVRHGKPILSPRDAHPAMKAADYREFWIRYDQAGLSPGSMPPLPLRKVANDARRIFVSVLPRSQESARAVVGDSSVEIDPVMVEASLPPPPLWGLRLRPRHWGIVARLAWGLGRAGGMESHTAARERARAAAGKLAEAAENEQNVVLFGHGWFNRMIISALRDMGWKVVDRRGGHSYWSWRLMVRRAS